MKRPKFSIIVLSFNKMQCTRRCMEGLLRTRDSNFELVVVDNGSTDGSVGMLEGFQKTFVDANHRMRLIRNPTNLGASSGRNQALQLIDGRIVVFMDNDVYAGEPDWLEKLAAVLKTDEKIGIVGPKLVFARNRRMIQFAGGGVSRTGRVQFVGRGRPSDEERFNRPRDVQFIISACMMFPRKLVEELGPLDEAFNPVQYEDIDFCYRARQAGHRVVYTPTVEMRHDESATTTGEPTLANKRLVIKHGLLFKKRWRHMFEAEDGPDDAETAWKPIGRFKRPDGPDR